jgi:hypothetical protein
LRAVVDHRASLGESTPGLRIDIGANDAPQFPLLLHHSALVGLGGILCLRARRRKQQSPRTHQYVCVFKGYVHQPSSKWYPYRRPGPYASFNRTPPPNSAPTTL